MKETIWQTGFRRFYCWNVIKFLTYVVVFSFLMGTGVFLLIMLMFQAIRLSEFVVYYQVPLKDVLRLSFYMMTTFLPVALPIAFLFAVLMGISRANSDGEILALQVGGLSLEQVFAPLFTFSIFVTGVCLWTALYTVPRANRAFELLITRLGSERAISQLKPGVFVEGFHGLTLFAEQIVPIKNEMKRIFIYDEREEAHPLSITAQAGVLKNVPEKGLVTLRLSHGSIYMDNKKPSEILQKIEFDVYDMNLDIGDRGEVGRAWSPPSYNFDQLRARLTETIADPPSHRLLQVEYHRRFSLSLCCLVFAALGFFIGALSQRGVRSAAIVLCLAVALVYWLSYVFANAVAISGSLPPWVAMWAPNLVFSVLAYYCYRRCRLV